MRPLVVPSIIPIYQSLPITLTCSVMIYNSVLCEYAMVMRLFNLPLPMSSITANFEFILVPHIIHDLGVQAQM